ncbi:TetR/AcrR family transcriptional regulator [Dactylosporangium sp. CA-092794]|uniref:TetR/AcrR family transcriptional regulator n=1 Tax=Dactylosporangium sp. CA-092794 TaxID=3239929 RepID=UPI003D8DDF92
MAAGGDGVDSRRTDTRERVLAVALELFARRGYRVTSLRELAEHLGVTKAAVYFHFRTKEEILTAILTGYLDGIAAMIADAAAEGPLTPEGQERLLRRFAAHQRGWGPDLMLLVRLNQTEIRGLPIGAEAQQVMHSLVETLAPEGAGPRERLRVRTALAAFPLAAAAALPDGDGDPDLGADPEALQEFALALCLEILRGGGRAAG